MLRVVSFRYIRILSVVLFVCVYVSSFAQVKKPKLVVTIVVEQMRYDYINRFLPHFSKAGFKKLLYQGVNCENAHTNYAYTQSASGIASISTATTPSMHGIVGNTWYNRSSQSKIYSVQDATKTCVGCKNSGSYTVSAQHLLSSTFSEELYVANQGKSKIFSIALEPQSAVLMAGKQASGVYWLDDYSGNWVTSSCYSSQLPLWLQSFNAKRFAELYVDRTWNTLLPINYYTESLGDTCNFEIGIQNQITFPYSIMKLRDNSRPYKILKQIPFGNTFTKDLAIEIIDKEKLGKDEFTDYLSIVFTATQEIGNKYGALSKELQDTYVRLDYELMFFIQYLEETIGKDNFLIVLTSNHGVAYSSKYTMLKQSDAGIFKHVESMYIIDKYLDTVFGNGDWILYYNSQQIYLNHAFIEKKHIPLQDVQRAAADFILQLSGVQHVMISTDLQKTDFCNNAIEHKIDNSFYQSRSGDIFIQLKPHWNEQLTDVVAGHASGYTYDSHVPLLWYGAGIVPKTIKKTVYTPDIIVTLSNLLSIPQPSMSTGTILSELFN